jgi:hypothetical protein
VIKPVLLALKYKISGEFNKRKSPASPGGNVFITLVKPSRDVELKSSDGTGKSD